MHQSSIKELFHPGRGACQVFPGAHLPGRLPCYVFCICLLTQLIISPATLSLVPNTQWVLPTDQAVGRNLYLTYQAFPTIHPNTPLSELPPPNTSPPTTNSSQFTQLNTSSDKKTLRSVPTSKWTMNVRQCRFKATYSFETDYRQCMSHNSRPGIQGLDDYFSLKFPYNRTQFKQFAQLTQLNCN